MIEYESYGNEPGALLALAANMAQRNVKESSWQRSIMAEIVPLPPSLPLEIAQSIQTGTTVFMLESLENPDVVVDPVALSRTVLDDTALANIIRSSNQEPDEEGVNLLRDIIDGQVEVIWRRFKSEENEQYKLKDSLAAARTVAEANGVSVSEVFAEDVLYAEYFRTLYTPQSYAEETTQLMENINQDYAMAALENLVETLLQSAISNGDILAEEYDASKEELLRELLQDDDFLTELYANLEALRQAGRVLIAKGIERFWGKPALDKLALSIGQLSVASAGESPLQGSLRKQEQYNDIIATVCMEQGWNPQQLTIEQMKYIHATPQMTAHQNEE